MKRRARYLIAFLPIILLSFLSVLFVRSLALPWWMGVFCLLFLAGIAGALFFLRNILLRRLGKSFVAKVMEEEDPQQEAPAAKVGEHLSALEQKWQEGVAELNGSHLGKLGDPVHALPWYLLLGGSGAGKSTALNSCGLSSPFFMRDPSDLVTPTENCDWWFLEKAVVLDTAGRYAVPVDPEKDREEWRHFVTLLARQRRKEPLNGVLLTVAADRLLACDEEANRVEGQVLRRRLDELMRVFKVRFPVYVLVTKCDLIEGMEPFCSLVPEEILNQPMGMINEGGAHDPLSFAQRTVEALLEKLRYFRLQLLKEPRGKKDTAALALFPEEFALMQKPLAAFMEGAFKETPYRETPALRGLFFGSGRQKGNPLSLLAGTLHPAPEPQPLPETGRPRFLNDLFACVLPRDRSLLVPTRRMVRWRTVTGQLGLISWVLLVTALCGVLCYSFTKNLQVIRSASEVAIPKKGGTLAAEVDALEKWRSAILSIEEENGSWRVPRVGLAESLQVERGLKERFCRRFKRVLLAPLDKEVERGTALLRSEAPDALYSRYAMHLVRRLNLLKARIGGNVRPLKGKPLPEAPLMPEQVEWDPLQEAPARFGGLYLSYLSWCDDAGLRAEAAAVEVRLKEVLACKEGDLRWLCHWVEHHEGLAPLTLAQFWGGIPSGEKEPVLYPTFTRKGRERLNALLVEIEAASGTKGRFDAAKREVDGWQRKAAFVAWHTFAMEFPRGVKRLRGNSEWQRVAAVVGTDRGPYLALLDRLTWELEPLVHEAGVPEWLKQLYFLQAARVRDAKGEGAIAKAAENGMKVLAGVTQKVKGDGAPTGAEPLVEITSGWRDYRSALAAIAPAAGSRVQSFQLASDTFADDPASGRSPFFAAYHALNRIRLALQVERRGGEVPWGVVAGPMEFLWSYIRREAAARLQEQWEEQVVPGAAELPPPQAAQVLLGPDGLAWKFAKGPAAPFLVRTEQGFRPKEVLGASVPLDGSFFSFMAKGPRVVATALSKQANYMVGVRAFPSEANGDAAVHPHGTRLELLCTGNTQTLVNLNYPTGKTLYWSPDSCGEVVLQVEVGDQVLTRRYGGTMGFPAFLQEFAGGSRTFVAADFPGERGALERMGIREIKVNYQFTGGAAVIKQALIPSQAVVPRTIGRSY